MALRSTVTVSGDLWLHLLGELLLRANFLRHFIQEPLQVTVTNEESRSL